MTKVDLEAAVQAAKQQTKTALETVLAELPKGQRKKLVKNPEAAALLERYGVEVDA